MNFSDSEVVAAIMNENGYSTTRNVEEADIVLINTCSIRDNAEALYNEIVAGVQEQYTDGLTHKVIKGWFSMYIELDLMK